MTCAWRGCEAWEIIVYQSVDLATHLYLLRRRVREHVWEDAVLLEALDNFVQGRDGLVEGCHSVLRIVSRKITSELPSEMGIAS